MAIENSRFVDPREISKPFEFFIELVFGADGVAIDKQFILSAETRQEPDQHTRSMLLVVTTDMKVFYQRRLEKGVTNTRFEPGIISPIPMRLSQNPKRRTFYIGTDYEINFHDATGGKESPDGNLLIGVRSKKPIRYMELIPSEKEFVSELQRIRNGAGLIPIMLR